MGGTLLVCALAIGALILYKKYGRGGLHSANPLASVLFTLPLGEKRNLMLVKIGRQVLVLGSTQQSVNCIAQLDADSLELAEEEVQQPRARTANAKAKRQDFSLHLTRELNNAAAAAQQEEVPRFDRVRRSLSEL